MFRTTVPAILSLLFPALSVAQVAISTNAALPDPSAMLDLRIDNLANTAKKALLLPRITWAERQAITDPADGLVIFQTDAGPGLRYFDAGTGLWIDWNAAVWRNAGGNFSTSTASHFVGTLDSAEMRVRAGGNSGGGFDLTRTGQWVPRNANGSVYLGLEAGYNAGTRPNEHNVYIGISAGSGPYSGPDSSARCTGIGSAALVYQHKSTGNTAVGSSALGRNQWGTYNTAAGMDADIVNVYDWYGHGGGTAVGYDARMAEATTSIGSGSRTGMLMFLSPSQPSTGAVAVGSEARADTVHSMALGARANSGLPETVRIGDADVTSIGGYAPWTDLSDIRFKQGHGPLGASSALINALRPISYRVDRKALGGTGNDSTRQVGFSAQELLATLQEHGAPTATVHQPGTDNAPYGIHYAPLVAHLVAAVQERDARNKALAERIQHMEALLRTMENLSAPR